MTPAQRRARKHFLALLRFVDRAASAERKRILAALNQAYGFATVAALEKALKSGSESAVMQAAGVGVLNRKLRSALVRTLVKTVEATGPLAAAELAVLLDTEINYPTFQARAIRWARGHAAKLVTGITSAQKSQLRKVINLHKKRGETDRQIAAIVKEHIGLDKRSSQALSGYQDRMAARVADGDITGARGAKLVQTYRRRLLAFRAESIGRTELINGVNQTQLNLWAEAAKRGILDDDELVKEWVGILRDGRICKHCYALHGQRRKIGEKFVAPTDGQAMDSPGKHTRCRCQQRLIRKGEAKEEMPPFVEPKKGRGLKPLIRPADKKAA